MTRKPIVREFVFLMNFLPICYELIYDPVAQLVEQWPFKPMVVGSIPTGVTKHKTLKLLRVLLCLIDTRYTYRHVVRRDITT